MSPRPKLIIWHLLALLFLFWVFDPPEAAAQRKHKKGDHSLEAGAWALQFQVRGSFTLGDFQGGLISAKYHTRDDAAIRFGISLRGRMRDTEQARFVETSDTLGSPSLSDRYFESQVDDHSYSIGVEAQHVWYSGLTNPIKFYGGLGPTIQYEWADIEENEVNEIEDSPNPPETRIATLTRTVWSGGVIGVVGAEWFPARRISLSGEYGLSLVYSHLRDERTDEREQHVQIVTTDEITSQIWDLSTPGVRFGLTVYL